MRKLTRVVKGGGSPHLLTPTVTVHCRQTLVSVVGTCFLVLDLITQTCGVNARVSSLITSQEAPLSPCRQPRLDLTLICIVVGHPQQALLWWKVATSGSFIPL